ncbi:MAG: hypothetical protein PHI55_15145, partial [Burkholderiaceae bacterium]|nr:hypothetical protein [Burkholderiaceae bacterium]
HPPLPPDAAAPPSSAPHDHGAGCAQCEICHTAGILPSGTPWATDPAPRSPPTSPRLSYTSAPSALADKPPIA